MGDADGRAEESAQVCARLDAEVLVKPLAHVGLALLELELQLGVVDVVAGACVAVDGVAALVEVALEGDAHRALLRAAAEEVLLAVVEHVEERPRDGFEDGGLARAVGADDGGRPALEDEGRDAHAVRLYVL